MITTRLGEIVRNYIHELGEVWGSLEPNASAATRPEQERDDIKRELKEIRPSSRL